MTKLEFIHSFYFSYNEKTIYNLCNHLNISADIATIYLDNLYYIEEKKYDNEKLDRLVSIKKYLFDNNLLEYDLLFREYLKHNEVVFYNIDLDKFDEEMIEELKKITKVTIENDKNKNYIPKIYEFQTLDEEVEFVAFKICELINLNIPITNIKIAGINEDYLNSIRRIFQAYNLKTANKIKIYSTNTVKEFINNYDSDINKTINYLIDSKQDVKVIDKIIDVVNKYNFVKDYNLVKEFILNDLKKVSITVHYENEIELVNINDTIKDDDYVFYLNYNLESIPKIYMDDNYITDDIRYLTKLDTTDILNKKERERLKRNLLNIKNLTISYKLKSPFASYSKANILDINPIKYTIPVNINYSTLNNQINLTNMLDDLSKYGKVNTNLALFNKHYKINYNGYDNKYKKIKQNELFEYLNNKLTLSYTSLNDYYKCSFRYYLKYILKIDKIEENITRYIGSIFHYVLEKCLYTGNDINLMIDEYISDNEIKMSIKEKFFLNKLKEELPFLISVIRKQDEYILLKKRMFEEKIEIEYKDKIDITFVGVIDKIMYDDNVFALIDYKTGDSKIDLSLNYYGINMQLAIYLYLANHKFNNAKFSGFYLQHILNKLNKSDDITKKQTNLKLVGYSNTKYIKLFDKTYKDSSLIRSLKVKNDNDFYSTSKVLTDEQVNNLIVLATSKVKEAINNIEDASFDINPKNIGNINVGCEFCNYKDVCFMKNKDIIYLDKKVDFL